MQSESNEAKPAQTMAPAPVCPPRRQRPGWGAPFLCALALLVITLTVYLPVGTHPFLTMDDQTYVVQNPHVATGLSAANIRWAFTAVAAANWHPLTWLSHMADASWFGMKPGSHHLTSVALHIISALLLFLLLLRLTDCLWQSFFVAALFALHPLNVESVAWVAERKNVLSTLFCFLTLHCYCSYAATHRTSAYLLTLAAFVLGLMAKPMLVTLPMVMLLLDYWPLGRWRRSPPRAATAITLVSEKIPFLCCALLSALVTFHAQQTGGALADLSVIPVQLRLENALVAYATYLGKTLWPQNLALYYPFPTAIPLWQVFAALCLVLFLSATAVAAGRQRPYLVVGWCWFVLTLVPVIGLIHVGDQALADRYTYIPVIGLFIITAWGAADLTRGLRHRQILLAVLAVIVISAAATQSRHQLGYWRDSITLYRHTLNITTANYIIHTNLGIALQAGGDLDGAREAYREALRIKPTYAAAHNNLGNVLVIEGDADGALREYGAALAACPNDTRLHNNLGHALVMKGELDAAIQEFRAALRLDPHNAVALANLASALARKGGHTGL